MPARYKVTDASAPRKAADPAIERLAASMLAEVIARTPHGETGDLAAGWEMTHGRAPAVYLISNPVPYAMYVEYGSANHGRAQPMAGPVIAEYRAKVGR